MDIQCHNEGESCSAPRAHDVSDNKKRTILREHMIEAGESLQQDETSSLVYEARMKLVGTRDSEILWLIPSDEDWEHDALDDVIVIPGVLYAEDEPFDSHDMTANGYFQDDESNRWIHVDHGCVAVNLSTGTPSWSDDLTEFPEVVDQFEMCMEDSGYRHLAEKAAMERIVRQAHDDQLH